MVTPSYMLNILEAYREAGLDLRASSLEVGIFGAEPWTNSMREELNRPLICMRWIFTVCQR